MSKAIGYVQATRTWSLLPNAAVVALSLRQLLLHTAGETWTPDDANPFQASTNIAVPHGTDPCKLWYATAGAGLMLGAAPPGIPGC
jgi:hypothetical protein